MRTSSPSSLLTSLRARFEATKTDHGKDPGAVALGRKGVVSRAERGAPRSYRLNVEPRLLGRLRRLVGLVAEFELGTGAARLQGQKALGPEPEEERRKEENATVLLPLSAEPT
jgi:hypothetical protein